MGDHLRALRWDAATLTAERDRRLRRLIAHAKERSPWHARRLRHVDEQALRADDLGALPRMSKGDLMDHFDEIVTDPRLTRSVVEAHLDNLPANPYLLDTYHVIASGGSSGQRGLFVYDWEGWADFFLGISRYNVADRRADPALSAAPNLVAVVAAGTGAHASSLIPRTFSSATGDVTFERVPLTLPIVEIVERLNAIQPVSLHGYPSAAPRARGRGPSRTAPHPATSSSMRQRTAAPRDPQCPGRDVECPCAQPVGHVRGRLSGVLLLRR